MEEKNYSYREREISLAPLVLSVLLRWRQFVVVMVAFALIFGIVGFISAGKANHNITLEEDASVEEIQKAKVSENTAISTNSIDFEYIKKISQLIDRNEAAYEELVQYYENSILMKLDANQVSLSTIEFLIVPLGGVEVSEKQLLVLEEQYKGMLQNEEFYHQINEEVHLDAEGNYLSEVIDISTAYTGNNKQAEDVDYDKGFILKVQVIYYNEYICKEIAQVILDYVKANQSVMTETHDQILIYSGYELAAMSDLLKEQKIIISYMADSIRERSVVLGYLSNDESVYYEELRKLQESMTEEMGDTGVDYAEIMEADGPDGESENVLAAGGMENAAEPTLSLLSRIDIKQILFGLLAGCFLVAVIGIIQYMLDNKLKAEDDLREIFGLYTFGKIKKKTIVKNPFYFIDEWLIRLFSGNEPVMSREEALSLTCFKMKTVLRKNDITEVFVIGNNLSKGGMVSAQEIQTYLEKENIAVKVGENICHDLAILEEVTSGKSIVLLETAGVTPYALIRDEMDICKVQGVNVLGAVVVI